MLWQKLLLRELVWSQKGFALVWLNIVLEKLEGMFWDRFFLFLIRIIDMVIFVIGSNNLIDCGIKMAKETILKCYIFLKNFCNSQIISGNIVPVFHSFFHLCREHSTHAQWKPAGSLSTLDNDLWKWWLQKLLFGTYIWNKFGQF